MDKSELLKALVEHNKMGNGYQIHLNEITNPPATLGRIE